MGGCLGIYLPTVVLGMRYDMNGGERKNGWMDGWMDAWGFARFLLLFILLLLLLLFLFLLSILFYSILFIYSSLLPITYFSFLTLLLLLLLLFTLPCGSFLSSFFLFVLVMNGEYEI